jgi:hypothetical protein
MAYSTVRHRFRGLCVWDVIVEGCGGVCILTTAESLCLLLVVVRLGQHWLKTLHHESPPESEYHGQKRPGGRPPQFAENLGIDGQDLRRHEKACRVDQRQRDGGIFWKHSGGHHIGDLIELKGDGRGHESREQRDQSRHDVTGKNANIRHPLDTTESQAQ